MFKPDGTTFEGYPHNILKKIIAEAAEMGYDYSTGQELEFFLFKTGDGLAPLPHDMGSYFGLSTDEAYKIRREMSIALEKY